jgi:adenine-specific DNA-methyltransferase
MSHWYLNCMQIQAFWRIIGQLKSELDNIEISNLLVDTYLRQNKVPESLWLESMHLEFSEKGLSQGHRNMFANQEISLKNIEAYFEACIETERKKSQGAVYTPNLIIDYLVRDVVRSVSIDTANLLDPACGSGGFLIRASEILLTEKRIPIHQSLSHLLYGIDNDPCAISHAHKLIDLFLLKNGIKPISVPRNIILGDTLLEDKATLAQKFGKSVKFHCIVTNPPYVKLQNLAAAYRKNLANKYGEFAIGSYSLSILFLIAMYELLEKDGSIGIITQNNLFTSLAGENIREYLQAHRAISKILDFSHNKVFENASAYTCLIFMDKKNKDNISYSQLKTRFSASTLQSAKFSPVPYGILDKRKWRLGRPEDLQNLAKIEDQGRKLGQIFNIRVGYATLKDVVFMVKQIGEVSVTNDGITMPLERDLLKPAIKIADFSDEESLAKNNRAIIFPYRKIDGRFRTIAEDVMRADYPVTYAYLVSKRELLQTRSKGNLELEAWYSWGRSQSMEAIGPKLLTKTFSRQPNFLFDSSDSLFCNGYAIFDKPNQADNQGKPTLKVLQRILNSNVMFYYAKMTSFQIEGDFQCYQKNFIEKFCIPDRITRESENILRMSNDELDAFLIELYGLNGAILDFLRENSLAA